MFKNWTNRDWFWLLGVLIGIIVLLIASIFAKSKNIEVNFGIISSAVSIALALVAIFFAWKQDSDNQAVTRETTNLLSTIRTKIEGMDSKIDRLDPRTVTEPVEDQLKDEIEKIISSIDTQVNPKIIDEINTMINEKFNSINQNLDFYYDKKPSNTIRKYYIKIWVPSNCQNEIPKFIKDFSNEFKVINISHSLEEDLLKVEYFHNKTINFKEIGYLVDKYGFTLNTYGMGNGL